MFAVILMSLSLAVDACAVAVSCGMSQPGFRLRHGLALGCWFGGFQFLMPLLGAAFGGLVSARSQAAAGLLSFGLLAFLGGRMLWDGLAGRPEEGAPDLTPGRYAALALATSLDALAAGVSLPCLPVPLPLAAGLIGVTAFALSLAGGLAGRRLGGVFRRCSAGAGGLVLIGIGVRILAGALGAG